MAELPFRRLKPGGVLSSRDYNRGLSTLEALARIQGQGDIGVTRSPAGYQIEDRRRKSLTIQITGPASGSPPGYAWRQVFWIGGQFVTSADSVGGTQTATPAIERNLDPNVAVGSYVEAEWADDGLAVLFNWLGEEVLTGGHCPPRYFGDDGQWHDLPGIPEGFATLVNGVATVLCSLVELDSGIHLTDQSPTSLASTLGVRLVAPVDLRTGGLSFVIQSQKSDGTVQTADQRVIYWTLSPRPQIPACATAGGGSGSGSGGTVTTACCDNPLPQTLCATITAITAGSCSSLLGATGTMFLRGNDAVSTHWGTDENGSSVSNLSFDLDCNKVAFPPGGFGLTVSWSGAAQILYTGSVLSSSLTCDPFSATFSVPLYDESGNALCTVQVAVTPGPCEGSGSGGSGKSCSGTEIVCDLFTDADGVLLGSHTPNIDTVGHGWHALQHGATSLTIQNDALVDSESANDQTTGGVIDTGQTNMQSIGSFTFGTLNPSAMPSVVARYDPTFSAGGLGYYSLLAVLDRFGNGELDITINGTEILAFHGVSLAVGEPFAIALDASGSTLTAYLNGVQVMQITDTTLTTGTYAGVIQQTTGGFPAGADRAAANWFKVVAAGQGGGEGGGSGGSGWSLVQQATPVTSTGATSIAISLPNPVTAGNVLVLGVVSKNGTSVGPTLSDNHSNSWVMLSHNHVSVAGGYMLTELQAVYNAAAGSTTVTVPSNPGTSDPWTIYLAEHRPPAGTVTQDAHNAGGATGTAVSISEGFSGSSTDLQLLLVSWSDVATTTVAQAGGNTLRYQQDVGDHATHMPMGFLDHVISGSAAEQATLGTSVSWFGVVASLKV